MWDWLSNLFSQQPTVYGGYYPGMGGSSRGSMWSDPLAWISLAGTGLGAYSGINNAMQAQGAYDAARRNADMYNRSIQDYYTRMDAFNAQRMGMFNQLMGGAMEAMMAPPASSYAPMSDAAARARRRGITAQAALRTGGNEGGYIDNLVAEGMADDELKRYEASARIDAILNQNRMALWPAILSAFAGMGGAPPPPITPATANYPANAIGGMGSVDAFGNYLKYRTQQDAMESERAANNWWRNQWNTFSNGPASMPRYSLYEPPMYDYEGPS